MWLGPFLYLVRVLASRQPEFQQNLLEYPGGHNCLRVCLSVHIRVCTRESEGQNERERELVSSAKTFLDTAGSFCPVLFIKVVVLRLTAHTHGLSRLSCGSSTVAVFPLSRTSFSSQDTCFGHVLLAISILLISVIHIGLLANV